MQRTKRERKKNTQNDGKDTDDLKQGVQKLKSAVRENFTTRSPNKS